MSATRRAFLQTASLLTATTLSRNLHLLASAQQSARSLAANDHIQITLIGAGIRGQQDCASALEVPNTRLIAVADCFVGTKVSFRKHGANRTLTSLLPQRSTLGCEPPSHDLSQPGRALTADPIRM